MRIEYLKINDSDFGDRVHYPGVPGSEFTLCGLVTCGDEDFGISEAVPADEPVDCEECIGIVTHVQSIVAYHMKNIPFEV